jgi:hypothetical protein
MVVNDKFIRTRKETAVVYFKALHQYKAGKTYENHQKPKQEQTASGPRIELRMNLN